MIKLKLQLSDIPIIQIALINRYLELGKKVDEYESLPEYEVNDLIAMSHMVTLTEYQKLGYIINEIDKFIEKLEKK